jgi:predicted DNA-binding transcriptional regulator AlpA
MATFRAQDGSFVLTGGELVNKNELMELLHVSKSTIQRMMRKGMPYTMFGNYAAYNTREVEEWLADNNYLNMELVHTWRKKSHKKTKDAE